jgi:hypothetical protein
MKASFVSPLAKIVSAFFLGSALLVATPFSSNANNDKGKVTAISEDQLSVQYTGSNENSVMFRVKFQNTAAQKFSLIIKNDVGDVVYQDQFTTADFNKAVHILKDGEFNKATFIIRVGNQQIEQRFVINRNTEVVENVVVTKL